MRPADRAAWRAWLERHHASSPGIWLVYRKKGSGHDRLDYGDAVEEALCFGWIDSIVRTIDATFYRQLFTPRKPASTWSQPNKRRVEKLMAAGLMRPAGLAAIETARQNGAWAVLDAVDALEMPPELATAFRRNAAAKRKFDAFPMSARKAYIYWVMTAKRPETRERRAAEVIRLSARNQKYRTASG